MYGKGVEVRRCKGAESLGNKTKEVEVLGDDRFQVDVKPFVKWVGGKRGILSQIMNYFPKKFDAYYEPFIGGGAVFFELYSKGMLDDKKVVVSDINSELINCYTIVKNSPEDLIKSLENFKKNHSKEFYYEIRSWDRDENFMQINPIDRAARFIYLNKTCFNGLYRVNRKSQFNVPMGKYKNPNIVDTDTIHNASKALKNVTIKEQSFKEVVKEAKKGDFVYFDPPYYPLNDTSNFTSYNEFLFLEEAQEELYKIFCELDKKGCYIVHSNSNTKFIKKLYANYDMHIVNANRFINSKSNGRGKIDEVLIRNFK